MKTNGTSDQAKKRAPSMEEKSSTSSNKALEPNDLSEWDINAYMNALDENNSESNLLSMLGNNANLGEFDINKLPIDMDMNNIDEMLKELNINNDPVYDLSRESRSQSNFSAGFSLPGNEQAGRRGSLREEKSTFNIQVDIVSEHKNSGNLIDGEMKDSSGERTHSKTMTPGGGMLQGFGSTPMQVEAIRPVEVFATEESPGKGEEKGKEQVKVLDIPNNSPIRLEGRSSSKTAVNLSSVTSGGGLNLNLFKSNSKENEGLEKNENVDEIDSSLGTPSKPVRKKMSHLEDSWISDLEKKIRYNEVENLYNKSKLNVGDLVQQAADKNRGLCKKEGIVVDKVKEFKFDSSQGNFPFKILLDKFDKSQSKCIKEIRRPRENNFYSALKEANWSSNGLSALNFDKDKTKEIADLIKNQINGQLVCFAVSEEKKDLIIIGTDLGDVVEVELRQKKVRRHKLESRVTSLDISPDCEKFVAGLQTGEVYLKKTFGSWSSKRQKIDDHPLLQVRFTTNDSILSVSESNIFRLELTDLKVIYDISKKPIIQNSTYPILEANFSGPRLVVCFVSHIQILDIEEKHVEGERKESGEIGMSGGPWILEKPDFVDGECAPSVSWLSLYNKREVFLLVFWGRFILLAKQEGGSLNLVGMKQLGQQVLWGQVLRNRVILVVFEDYEVHMLSVQTVFVNLMSGGGFEAKFKLSKLEYAHPRELKIEGCTQAVKISGEIIRSSSNVVYFLKKDTIFRVYLFSLQEMAREYSEKGEWLPAFKLCVEVCEDRISADDQEKLVMKSEAVQLSLRYTEKFLEKSKTTEELQSRMIRICIEALLSTGNLDYLFKKMRLKFDEISFWKEIDIFIENGLLNYVPISALKDGGLYLQSDSFQFLVFQFSTEELLSHEEEFNQVLMMLKRRKLWPSLYRIGFMTVESTLNLVLSTMMGELMSVTSSDHKDIEERIQSDKFASSVTPDELFEDNRLSSYLRIFWYLRTIVNWNVETFFENNSRMEDVWAKTIEWLVDPQNIKVMTKVNISAFLEIFFELFLNIDFSTSELVASKMKDKIDRIKGCMDDSSLYFRVEEESHMDNFFVFKAVLGSLFQFCDKKYSQDVSFLALKVVTLSVFKNFYEEKELLRNVLRHLVQTEFVGGRLWFHFEPISKEDYEEQIIRVLKNLKHHSIFDFIQAELDESSLEAGFCRVHCYFQELKHGPLVALKKKINLVRYGNPSYLFNWIKKNLVEIKDNQLRSDFQKEIVANLGYLIRASKLKAKEVIVMIPNIGIEAIETLK